MKWAAVLVALFWASNTVAAPECRDIEFRDQSYTICQIDLTRDTLRLFLRRPDGGPHGSFSSINKALAPNDMHLSFAMNAGMYHRDRSPVGLYVEDGTQEQRLITSPGPGNFGLLPNGVLCLQEEAAHVIETLRFQRENPPCTSATQSGPMLVIDGALHPRFLIDSTSRYVRNGVGTSTDGKTAIFAISNRRVSFHEFGSLFKDALNIPNALYFDGNISRLHAPSLNRSDAGFAMGPIIGTIGPRND
ncbi:MAG: phosphodiester glycosidase family protein [Paracoccaceae bacterium]